MIKVNPSQLEVNSISQKSTLRSKVNPRIKRLKSQTTSFKGPQESWETTLSIVSVSFLKLFYHMLHFI